MTHPLHDTVLHGARRRIRVVATERADGDMHPLHAGSRVGPWWMLDQVHGISVHSVAGGEPLAPTAGIGDVLVTDQVDVTLAVWTADCAPIVLAADDGTVVAAHGGWRGLERGVVDVAVDAAERGGGTVVAAVLGPVIHPCCYAFGAADAERVASAAGAPHDRVVGRTVGGDTTLDIPAVVAHGLARRGVSLDVIGPCTGCDRRWFSHRVHADTERHATVVSVEAA